MENKYAVMPANVLYSNVLTDREKLLVAAINNMSNQKGYCFASDNHFAEMLNCTKRTIQRALKNLEEMKIINRVIKVGKGGNVELRGMVVIAGGIDKADVGYGHQCRKGMDTGVVGGIDTGVVYKRKYIKNKTKNRVKKKKQSKKEIFAKYILDKGISVAVSNWYSHLKKGQIMAVTDLPQEAVDGLLLLGATVDDNGIITTK